MSSLEVKLMVDGAILKPPCFTRRAPSKPGFSAAAVTNMSNSWCPESHATKKMSHTFAIEITDGILGRCACRLGRWNTLSALLWGLTQILGQLRCWLMTLLPPPTRQKLCDRSFFCLSVCWLLKKWKADFIETCCCDWPTSWKNWFAFGGALVPDTDSGSFFHFPHHCRIGDFRSSGTTKSVAPGGKTLNGAPTPSPPPSSLPSPPNSSTSFPSLSPFPSLPSLRSRPP